jgi:hypothetical protein
MRSGAPPNNNCCINEAHVLFSLKEALKMAVQWNKDVDAALTQAKADKKPLLLDFSAAPA